MKEKIIELLWKYEDGLSDGYQYYGGKLAMDAFVNELIELIDKPVETTNEQPKDIYQKQQEFFNQVNIKDLSSCTTLEAIQLFSDYLNKVG
jgi:hypothetical protein